MGLIQVELTPFQVTPISPPTKNNQIKFFQVARTLTTSTVVAEVPGQSTLLSFKSYAGVASNAATTATVTLTATYTDGTVIGTGTFDAKANATGNLTFTNLPNLEPRPSKGDIQISAVYAETGGASTTGGPWIFQVDLV